MYGLYIVEIYFFDADSRLRVYIFIYIFIQHQDGSTVHIRRLNKIYNLTKKQHMKQSSPSELRNDSTLRVTLSVKGHSTSSE